jgi:hypothetical protein
VSVTRRHRNRKLPDPRWTLIALAASVPIVLAAFGAIAARPINDDYWFQANLTSEGDVLGAFSLGLRTWSAFYSMYALLTAGAAASRTVGFEIYYPLASLLVIALFLQACVAVVRMWFREMAITAPVLPAGLLLCAAVLASLATFRHPDAPVLFGALYWQSAWVPHVVPILALPTVLMIILRRPVRRSRFIRPEGVVLGLLLAGFSFGPASVALIMAALFSWVVHQLRGREAFRQVAPGLINFAAGIAVGTGIVFVLPGTSVRQAAIAAHRQGMTSAETLTAIFSTAWEVAASSLLTPAIVVGLLAGLLLRRLAAPYPAGSDELRAVRTTRRALGAGLALSWLPISVGSYVSYLGFWHWWPLMLLWTAFCATVGWALAARIANRQAGATQRSGPSSLLTIGTTRLALAVVVVWGALAAGYSASAVWQRRSPSDRNLQSGKLASDRGPAASVEWTALPLPYLDDVRPGASESWTNRNVARWLGVEADALTVIGVEVPRTTVPVLSTLPPFLAAEVN